METKDKYLSKISITRKTISIIQINLGNLCNQTCSHCHIEASPNGKNVMTTKTAQKIIDKLKTMDVKNVEFTGGTPEMNENLELFIKQLNDKNITVRTSLTVLASDKYKRFIDIYKKNNVKIICSLPSLSEDISDEQRGSKYYKSAIKTIKKLNDVGYGKELDLDIVYNPVGDFLPPSQNDLETKYKEYLKENYGVVFSKLSTIVNVPIKRFKKYLIENNKYNDYINLLFANHNQATWENVMCRTILNVGHDGRIYDCDFNYALGTPVAGYEETFFWDIDFDSFESEIVIGEHCLACTVNRGSSCHGELTTLDIKNSVKEYYGKEIKSTKDLKTSACCNLDEIPEYVKEISPMIADEIVMKYYGCGSPIPLALEGSSILDLGCGTGKDSYIASKIAGETGKVTGIDMTDEQIDVAKKYIKHQMKEFGFKKTNINFIHDFIENIDRHTPESSVDVVISNCVINLLENKKTILEKILKVLKEGGEFYFSDVYADRRLPEYLKNNKIIYGECLGGALYVRDFEDMARAEGFSSPMNLSEREIKIEDKNIKKLTGNIKFYSITYRLFKIHGYENRCEDYGHTATYKGGIKYSENLFLLDNNHIFEKNRPVRICGDTARILSKSRFSRYFEITGSFDEHFGAFASDKITVNTVDTKKTSSCC